MYNRTSTAGMISVQNNYCIVKGKEVITIESFSLLDFNFIADNLLANVQIKDYR